MLEDLNERSREVFRRIVDEYMQTGEPVGSRTISKLLTESLSPASVRNVMSDLEELGLLYAPHISAGRLPTEQGLKLYIDGVMEIGDVPEAERAQIESQCAAAGRSMDEVMRDASTVLSGLSDCTGLVMAPKSEGPLKHIEFVHLSPGRALVVMVTETGVVENRIIEIPADVNPSALVQASNYLGARLVGRSLDEAMQAIQGELQDHQTRLDELTQKVVEAGLASWSGGDRGSGSLIVRGQSKLLEDVQAIADLERIRSLFEALETRETMMKLLGLADQADGVQIFIGSDNPLFDMSGSSMIVAPFRDGQQKIVGAIGIIGPTRINYARIIPMVDYTSKVIGRLIG